MQRSSNSQGVKSVNFDELKKDCSTCQFNFTDNNVCAAAHYGIDPTEIMKDANNFPCADYKIDFDLFVELGESILGKKGYL